MYKEKQSSWFSVKMKTCYSVSKQIKIICNLHNFFPKLIDAVQIGVTFFLYIAFELGKVKTHEPQVIRSRLARRLNLRLGQNGKLVSASVSLSRSGLLPLGIQERCSSCRLGVGEMPHDQF